MRKTVLILLVAAMPLTVAAQCDQTTRKVTGNWEVNLLGVPDTRANTCGRAEAIMKTLTFFPPAGCVVKVLKLSGDLVAWPIFALPPVGQDRLNRAAGTLLSIARSGPAGSRYADWAEDKTLLYIQLGVAEKPERAGFSEEIEDGLLPDGRLDFKLAVWLNATEQPIHMEATWTIRYQFVPIASAGQSAR